MTDLGSDEAAAVTTPTSERPRRTRAVVIAVVVVLAIYGLGYLRAVKIQGDFCSTLDSAAIEAKHGAFREWHIGSGVRLWPPELYCTVHDGDDKSVEITKSWFG